MATVALVAESPAARAALPATQRFAGIYTLTQVGGAGVQHIELNLRADGTASMRTDFSRHTQRPVASDPVPPVLETGTWHERRGKAIVHITSTSDDDPTAAQSQKPQYSDLTFVLSGCELRLVTNAASDRALEFSKRHCIDGT